MPNFNFAKVQLSAGLEAEGANRVCLGDELDCCIVHADTAVRLRSLFSDRLKGAGRVILTAKKRLPRLWTR
jgi:hypothetical protein